MNSHMDKKRQALAEIAEKTNQARKLLEECIEIAKENNVDFTFEGHVYPDDIDLYWDYSSDSEWESSSLDC